MGSSSYFITTRSDEDYYYLAKQKLNSSYYFPLFPSIELANPQHQEELAETDTPNRRVVFALYQALLSLDVSTVHKILAPDLEWWFHGPPSHQFLMRLLTGADNSKGFSFQPQVVTSFGPVVLAEGCDPARSIYWVHAWTVSDGIITQVREYFNTSLTVTRVGDHASASSSSSEITKAHHCTSVWESSLSERAGKSVPGLVLAI
ncbi:hypothetical protein MLD38_011083 [Melastoma candidum]|uniref:Uncharacterized protein n=1 Tax=Melastoma candidum TaxID=119954 RepID=A0ACB9R390_9MYRT|nr:hypothetical protein MLD38_011083 [Melastoma candidum]